MSRVLDEVLVEQSKGHKLQFTRYVNGFIGATFLVLAAVHLDSTSFSHVVCNVLLLLGGVLALTSLWHPRNRLLGRSLAIATMVLMFTFFALFFSLVPQFAKGWYASAMGLEAISSLIGAFALIPVLASHSCHLKGDCAHSIREKRLGFFAPPDKLRKQTTF